MRSNFKWSITYFYNVRHLTKNQMPLSTAMFPPKWYAESNKSKAFLDKNLVINGLTIHEFVPKSAEECPCVKKNPAECSFLKMYRKQLHELSFEKVIQSYEELARKISSITNIEIDEIVLLVYEKPTNACSERVALKELFHENGQTLKELEVTK